ncbi:MAG: ATP-binding protein [Sulfurimonas sp.]
MKITIASGKGGTGKTTLSSNLVSYLADQNQQVVLADLDVEEPNSAIFIQGELKDQNVFHKLVPKWDRSDCTFCGKCAEVCNFNAIIDLPGEIRVYPALCHSCHACSELCPTGSPPMTPERIGEIREYHYDKLALVEGILDLGQEMAVPLIGGTIDYVDEKFDGFVKILDAPPGTSCPVIEASRFSDFVLLVTESTPFGLNDLILAVETMRVLHQKFGVVINRHGIGDNSVEAYCAGENIPIVTKIRNDQEVAKLYAKGELIYPKIGHFRNSIEEIVSFIGGLQ